MLWDGRWAGSATSIPVPAGPLLEHKDNTPLQALQPPACPPTLSIILPAAPWSPALRTTAHRTHQCPSKTCHSADGFLSQQMATPSIGLRQTGGGLPRLFPLPDSPRSLFSSSCLLWVSVVVRELSLVVMYGLLIAAGSVVEHRL